MSRPRIRAFLFLLLAANLSACSSMSYYWQALNGQLEVMERRQPITSLLEDAGTPEALKAKLSTAVAIRRFASAELGLPDNASYTSYADLEREAVVWNVFVTPPLSLSLQEWCFPVTGCVSYRGYFSKRAAQNFAHQQHARGADVYVGAVPAYSTLGWFDDPLLNTVIERSDAQLAALIFHELAHQQLYVPGDTVFNESFATAVELEGVKRWLAARGSVADSVEWQRFCERQQQFIVLLSDARADLQMLYTSSLDEAGKTNLKHQRFAELRAQYAALKQEWGGYPAYDAWFDLGLNNASLAATNAYHDYVPQLTGLLEQHGGDLAAFYQAARQLAALAPDDRHQALLELGITRQARR